MKKYLFIAISAILWANAVFAQNDTLHVYGPGGPLSAMLECAQAFHAKTGIPVKVTGGPEAKWLLPAQQNSDLIYGGAEYMLTQFMQTHPEIIDSGTLTELYKRRAAILVKPGNPKHIRALKDLARPGIHILDVNGAGQFGLWEDIAGKADLIGQIRQNIWCSFANTALGIDAWKKNSHFDAWITYASWHQNLKNLTEIIELPESHKLYRGTPIAIATNSRQKAQAMQFVLFLKSEAGHSIFKKWGWE